jgi:hypothetical protein
LKISGTKVALVDRLQTHLARIDVNKSDVNITAIDVGLRNLAYMSYTLSERDSKWSIRVQDWKLHNLGIESSLDLQEYVAQCHLLTKGLKAKPDLVVMEKQMPISVRAGIRGNYKVLVIEAILFSLLTAGDIRVQSISSTSISRLFELKADQGRDYLAKKQKSVSTVKSILQGEPAGDPSVSVSKYFVECFRTSIKKDDLADCFLIGLGSARHYIHSVKLKREYNL